MMFTQNARTFALVIGAVSCSALLATSAHSSDHQEAPGVSANLAADIGDYYVWHEGNDVNLVLTFGTFAVPEMGPSFDSNILYEFHFDTSVPADGVSDLDIFARFAQDDAGEWGIQVSGFGTSPIEGAVETVLSSGDVSVWAGLADDPFFFDQSGFNQTVSTGTLSFDPTRDDVAGFNVTAIAIQVPASAIQANGTTFQTWSTTGSL